MTTPFATPYNPQTWTDLPTQNTPVSAARLSVMERGIRDGGRLLDRPGGFVSQDPPTRRASYAWGCGGSGSITSYDTGMQRLPVMLPVTTVRWRLRVANNTPSGVSTGAGSVTYTATRIGVAARSAQGLLSKDMTAAPALALGSSGAIAAGAEWVSGWVTNAAHQLTATETYHIQLEWSKTAGSTAYLAAGGAYVAQGTTGNTTANPSLAYNSGAFFNIAIEYEFVGGNKIGVAVGDSVTEGTGQVWNFNGWHHQLAMRTGMPMCLSAEFGSFAGADGPNANWGTQAVTLPKWQRLRDADCNIDFGIIYLGINETAWSGTLANAQAGLVNTMNRMRSEWGVRDVYVCTLHPRNLTDGSAGENLRRSINSWFRSGDHPFEGVFNFDRFTEASSNALNVVFGFGGGAAFDDYTHLGPAGHSRFADAIQIGW